MNLRFVYLVCCIAALATRANAASISTDATFVITKTEESPNPTNDVTTEEPNAPIKLTDMQVTSEISLRYAHTAVVTRVRNPARRAQQTTFHVLLPQTAFISGFVMTLNGKSYQAYVKEKDEAKKIYKSAVSQGISGAHISAKVRDSNHFTVSVNVEPNTIAVFNLTYEELLVRHNGVYKHAINLHPGSIVPNMEVTVHIKESQKISTLRIPEMRTGNEVDNNEDDTKNTKVVLQKGEEGKEATVTFTPDIEEQKRLLRVYMEKTRQLASTNKALSDESLVGVLGQFVVLYDVERPQNGEILVNDGYFVHFFAPPALKPLSKHVVFVLDTSGSMSGRRIEQLKEAMRAILNDLHPRDYFSIVEFNSNVKVYKLSEALNPGKSLEYWGDGDLEGDLNPPELASAENIAKAQTIVSKFVASGGTCIYKALDVAVDLVNRKFDFNQLNSTIAVNEIEIRRDEIQPIIIFLTDGSANIGESDNTKIVSSISEKNNGVKRAAIYSLALGQDADRNLLQELSLHNEGFMRHIYEASDTALQLENFYNQISSPLLSHVNFVYPPEQVKEGSLTQHKFKTVFLGAEMVVAGELAPNTIQLTPQLVALCADEDVGLKNYEVKNKVDVVEKKDYFPLERLLAHLTLKQLLDERNEDTNQKNNTKNRALAIAMKYGFVTPLTSLVVVKPNATNTVEAESVDGITTPAPATTTSSIRDISSNVRSIYGNSHGSNILTQGISLRSGDEDWMPTYHMGYDNSNFGGRIAGNIPSYDASNEEESSRGGPSYDDFDNQYAGDRILSGVADESDLRIIGPRNHYPSRDFGGQYPHSSHRYQRPVSHIFRTSSIISSPSTESSVDIRLLLKDYNWALSLLKRNTSSIEFVANGKHITLELSKSEKSPKDAVDSECTRIADESIEGAARVCVYLTRCAAARLIAPFDYPHVYCTVQNKYAGICCPINMIDVKAD